MVSTLLMAIGAGFLSTLHCWGMCGGIVAALALGAPAALRERPVAMLTLGCLYNLGRIASYTLAGGLAGLAASSLDTTSGAAAYRLLQLLSLLALMMAGLQLGGWLPRGGLLEAFGVRAWRHVAPLTRCFLPIDRWQRALGAGLVWGFMPCGLVYAMLPVSAASGSVAGGALTMLAFGSGTLPGMVLASVLAHRLASRATATTLRRAAGASLIALALTWFGLQTLEHGAHNAHDHHHGGLAVTAPAALTRACHRP